MEIKPTPLKDCYVIHHDLHKDDRGYFMEAFNRTRFKKFGLDFSVEQINIAESKKDVFRGLHFQLNPFAQTKIVSTLSGAVIDLVVDLRKTSESYLQYFKIKLDTPDKALFIPKGFAHGYFTLEDHTSFQYAVDQPYHAASERSLSIYDPILNIKGDFTRALISPKDLASQSFSTIEQEL
tara:strand:- start:274 stop:813 length:540 start_codon:yes stop_codon:yes gene_type:complete